MKIRKSLLIILFTMTAMACQAETTPAPINTAIVNTPEPAATATLQPETAPTVTVKRPTAGTAAVETAAATAVGQMILGEPFTLRLGETAVVEPGKLTMAFTAVTDDSRCPKDVVCVWQGEAFVFVTMQAADKEAAELRLNTNPPQNSLNYGQYTVQLEALHPAPISDQEIPQDQYEATFIISQQPD